MRVTVALPTVARAGHDTGPRGPVHARTSARLVASGTVRSASLCTTRSGIVAPVTTGGRTRSGAGWPASRASPGTAEPRDHPVAEGTTDRPPPTPCAMVGDPVGERPREHHARTATGSGPARSSARSTGARRRTSRTGRPPARPTRRRSGPGEGLDRCYTLPEPVATGRPPCRVRCEQTGQAVLGQGGGDLLVPERMRAEAGRATARRVPAPRRGSPSRAGLRRRRGPRPAGERRRRLGRRGRVQRRRTSGDERRSPDRRGGEADRDAHCCRGTAPCPT